jgi:hypothetical protein
MTSLPLSVFLHHSSRFINRILLFAFVNHLSLFPPLCAFVSSYPFVPLTWSPLSVSGAFGAPLSAALAVLPSITVGTPSIAGCQPHLMDDIKQLLACVFIECSDMAKIGTHSLANVHLPFCLFANLVLWGQDQSFHSYITVGGTANARSRDPPSYESCWI